MSHSVDAFLQRTYEASLPRQRVCDVPAERASAVLLERRGRLYDALCLDRWFGEGFEPTTTLRSESTREGITIREADIALLEDLSTPLFVLSPAQANGKAILYANGHGKTCAEILRDDNRDYYTRFLPVELARRGYTVYLHEPIGFGDVTYEGFREREQRGCYAISTFLLNCGANLAGLRVYQALCVLEVISRTFQTIGMAGISGGGMVTALTLPLTDRVRAGCVLGYASLFRDSTMRLHHCIDNFVHGILSVGEAADILALAHPCRLLLSAGDADPIFPIDSATRTASEVEAFYRRLGSADAFGFDAFVGGHEIHVPAVLRWFDEQL